MSAPEGGVVYQTKAGLLGCQSGIKCFDFNLLYGYLREKEPS
jgi:hypothetical protein